MFLMTLKKLSGANRTAGTTVKTDQIDRDAHPEAGGGDKTNHVYLILKKP